jgi:hypothetical protein
MAVNATRLRVARIFDHRPWDGKRHVSVLTFAVETVSTIGTQINA